MSDPINELRGIVPLRYVPKFLRNQFVAEEVVQVKRVIAGHYDPRAFSDCAVKYHDRTLDKDIIIEFSKGEIWKLEVSKGEGLQK